MLLGIDFGKKRIGLAIGEVIPRGIGILDGTKPRQDIVNEVNEICIENEVTKIILGLPFLASGDEGVLAAEARKFGDEINAKTLLPVVFEEEQYTSAEAERILEEYGVKYDRRGGKVDEMAAVLILEQYINNHR